MVLDQGHFLVPEGPGLGVELDEDGDWLRVQVDSAVAAPLLDRLPLVLSASASALPESPP